MHTFLFRCPATGLTVQGRLETEEPPEQRYVAQDCAACGSLHPVNPRTGKLMSEEVPRQPRPR
ncbi:MAG: hypothetical protein FJX11_14415 [Alphaproteobacteria bacterium]|nr:hypothetical protein [Alphaproteobacteria bacterium]